LVETSIDGAPGLMLNLSGGTSLSLCAVQEAADLVPRAADEDVKVSFGNVLNENVSEDVIVTVIDTGCEGGGRSGALSSRPSRNAYQEQAAMNQVQQPQQDQQQEFQNEKRSAPEETNNQDDTLDIPTFVRNRNKNR